MKKISFVIDDITCTGGTERVTCLLSNNLSTYGYNVTIYSLNFSQNSPKYYLDKNVTIQKFNNIKIISLYKTLRMARKNKESLIVISMGKLSVNVALLSLLQKPKQLIFAEHISFDSFSLLKKTIKKLAYSRADNVVFLTEHDKNLVSKKANVKYLNIENINSFYNSQCEITSYQDRPNIAIAIGRYGYQKNFERLIQIWKKTKIKDWKLIIIGSDNYPLKNLIDNTDSIDVVTETNTIEYYYNQAKIILMSSRYEGLPMVLIEAQHFGIPAIAFDCQTGPREIIINESTGFLIDYHNDNLFIEKLEKLINDQSLLYHMHLNSIKNSINYEPEKIIKKWVNLFK
ncbi:MAG: glycosyltransferase [Pseudomonadota bacterium]